ncbi:hypothetical protein MKW94_005016, partial [Papaver nudicaule]|nr:hypothetical protein [Papaver nudicaule]
MALEVVVNFECFLFLMWMYLASAEIPVTGSQIISKPNCPNHCRNVSIPYPFGIGAGCFLDKWFEISCVKSLLNSTKPELYRHSFNGKKKRGHGYNVSSISILDGQMTTEVYIARNCPGSETPMYDSTAGLGKFTFSNTKNKFIGMGCNTWAYLGQDNRASIGSGCLSVCNKTEDIINGSCTGVGCCEAAVPAGLKMLNMRAGSMFKPYESLSFNPCSYGFLIEEKSFKFSTSYLMDFKSNGTGSVPVVVDWTVGNKTCHEAKKNSTSYACGPHTDCIVPAGNKTRGYRCKCKKGYAGNPYLSTTGGCQDVDECKEVCMGPGANCENAEGSYNCTCNKGYKLNDDKSGCIPESHDQSTQNNRLIKIVI